MSNKAQNKAIQIYQTIQQQLPKPEMIVFNDPHTTDQYKFGVVKLDENFYYDGVVRGNRPDGIGIMAEKKQMFSVRGRFSNTKLCGAGRVELETGEIYDGVFRNGIFCSGICYHSKEDRFIYGNFKTPEIKILLKGKGYPYQLFLNNKEKLYDSTLIYKTTCSEIIFAPQEDRHLVREFDRLKYNFDLVSHQSSYQDSIFETSEIETNRSLIQEEMGTANQYFKEYDRLNTENIQVLDSEAYHLIEKSKLNYLKHQNAEDQDDQENQEEQDEEHIKMTADFSHQGGYSNQFDQHYTVEQIQRMREQRMKEIKQSSNKSNLLIENLKSKLDTYDKLKKQQQVNQTDYLSQIQLSNISNLTNNYYNSNQNSDEKSNRSDNQNDSKLKEFKHTQAPFQSNQQQVNKREDSGYNSIQSQKFSYNNNNINNNTNYNNNSNQINTHQFTREPLVDNFNSPFKAKGTYIKNNVIIDIDPFSKEQNTQDFNTGSNNINNTQSVQDTPSQQSYATFSNKKNGRQLFYSDNDDIERFKQPSNLTNQYINIEINQSANISQFNQENINNSKFAQFGNQDLVYEQKRNTNPKIVVNDLSRISMNQSPKKEESSFCEGNLVGSNYSSPSLKQIQNQNFDAHQDSVISDNNKQYSGDTRNHSLSTVRDKLQKQLNEQEFKQRSERESIEFQRSLGNWDEESKEEVRNRQKSQFSVDFDPNIITTSNKSNEQEVIENYFNNLRVQLTDKNMNNSTGTISALNEILSDHNYQSKGKTEDNSLIQILEERAGQNVRSLSIEKNTNFQRKFLDTSIQYLESEHNINMRDSHNNSGFTHSFDRSERKTIDKQNPSQFYRFTQNSLSERNDEDDEDSSSFHNSGENPKGIDSVIEDIQCYSQEASSCANDRAFINSNLNLTDGEL